MPAARTANTFTGDDTEGEFKVHPWSGAGHAVDVLAGTPSKMLEMTRSNGRDRESGEGKESCQRKWVVGRPEVSLFYVERVVADEADILFGAHTYTQAIL